MRVKDGLPGGFAFVDGDVDAVRSESLLKLGSKIKHDLHGCFDIFRIGCKHVFRMCLRNDKDMAFHGRKDIKKSDDAVIFVEFVGREFAGNNSAENTGEHSGSNRLKKSKKFKRDRGCDGW